MNAKLNIEMDGQAVKYSPTPPKRLSKKLFHLGDVWGIEDPRADVMVQRSATTRNVVWEYSFFVKQRVKLHFCQTDNSIVMLFNFGAPVKLQMGSLAPEYFDTHQYNLYSMPGFELTVFPEPNQKKFELFVIEVGNGSASKAVMDLLAEIARA